MKNILIIILIFSIKFSFAQSDTLTKYYDNSDIEIRKMSDKDIDNYKGDKDFDYRKEIVESENYFAKIFNKIIDFLFGNKSPLGKIIKYIIIALFFAFIISRLLGFKVYKLFYKNKSFDDIIPIQEDINDINKFDIEATINTAIKGKDYKKAVRYLFIKTLKYLSDNETIEWQINKTNRDYYYEITDENVKEIFVKLSQIFSYVWYGNFSIDEVKFKEFEDEFEKIFK